MVFWFARFELTHVNRCHLGCGRGQCFDGRPIVYHRCELEQSHGRGCFPALLAYGWLYFGLCDAGRAAQTHAPPNPLFA